MSIVNRRYLPGYTGTALINNVDQAIDGWAAEPDAGLWDATTPDDAGWLYQEAGQQKIVITCSMKIKVTAATSNGATAYTAVMPTFCQGMTITAVFYLNGVAAYQGSWIVDKFGTKNDLKGGCMIDLSLTSQGPITGSLVLAGLTVPVTAPTPAGS